MKVKLKFLLATFLLVTVLFNINVNKSFEKGNDFVLSNLFQTAEANAESTTATVKCKDTEPYANGLWYERICTKNSGVYCKWDHCTVWILTGTCTFSN